MRRVRVNEVKLGSTHLESAAAHHLRDVLRLEDGAEVEVFDSSGRTGKGRIADNVTLVHIDSIESPPQQRVELTVASAIPKGARGDWMVEKLSEIGVARFVPLKTARSVVEPAGHAKIDRWNRLASEAARQSQRTGVMVIESIVPLEDFLHRATGTKLCLSVAPGARPFSEAIGGLSGPNAALIGPEGGWSDDELQMMEQCRVLPVRLTPAVLRVETAAVLGAGIILSVLT